jgi:hypothetical protein
MMLVEEIAMSKVTVAKLGFQPRKTAATPVKRKRRKVPVDKTSKVGMSVKMPLTRKIATMLGVEDLLYEENSEIARDGFKRIALDSDKIMNVNVKVREKDPEAVLEIIADALERFTVRQAKGTGPVIELLVRATGYISQIADFAAVIEDHEFTMVCSPVQSQLFDTSAPRPAKGKGGPEIYAV